MKLNSSTVTHSTPPSSVAETCHTSALMNRNVMNSRSSGSARVTIGKSSRRLRIVRPMAHFAIGQAPSSRPA